jgi:DNA polymerase-3 subunit gamma/tau
VPQVSRGSTLFSMQYQVLARKWRPQSFHELVGQEHVSRTLLNALQSSRVAHAFLFSGPRGSGKTTSARILAKALNCHAGIPGEPCGQCVSCSEITAGHCIDVIEIDAASNNNVDNIRTVIEEVQYRPARDRNKIYIVDEVHMLSNAAFNALLKTLEEPPSYVTFILATTEYHKIPATILSRCQQYSFKLIRYPLILNRLRSITEAENIRISTESLEQIAFSSGGSMRDAMSALDQVIAFSGNVVRDEDVNLLLGLVEPALLGDVVRAIAENDSRKILEIVADLAEAGQDFRNFCRRLQAHMRNLMVLKSGITDPAVLGAPESLLPDLGSQAARFSREDLLRLFDGLMKIEAALKDATQVRFQLEMGLLELAHLPALRPLEELIAEFGKPEEHNLTNNPAPAPPETGPVTRRGPHSLANPVPKPAPADVPALPAGAHAHELSDGLPLPSVPASVDSGAAGGDPRSLLMKIAASVQKESLESFLQALQGARLDGDLLILDPGSVNSFYRKQVEENLPAIVQAASRVLERQVRVRLGEAPQPQKSPAVEAQASVEEAQLKVLDRARREPVVQSFLDVFPGPVKAEKLDS